MLKIAFKTVFDRAVISILLFAVWTVQVCLAQPTLKGNLLSSAQANSDRNSTRLREAVHIADFILNLQTADGAIPDRPGVTTVNEDSNMEYALMGLGAAYLATKDQRYRDGLESGIRWLAARQEMTDPVWRGSWRYVYSAVPPFAAIPTSAGEGIKDVRGVDATSTLFVYLLYLHERVTHTDTLARRYDTNAKAALDFVIRRNLDKDGFSQSSWQQRASDGQWHIYAFKYSADQGDVYLGMKAGSILYHVAKYERIATFLKASAPRRFFAKAEGRYALGLNEKGDLDHTPYVFAQGYLPWIWGDSPENREALSRLQSKIQRDGSLVEPDDKPASSLSVAMLCLGEAALGQTPPSQSLKWLLTVLYDSGTGGVRETADPKTYEYDNVAGFCLMSLVS